MAIMMLINSFLVKKSIISQSGFHPISSFIHTIVLPKASYPMSAFALSNYIFVQFWYRDEKEHSVKVTINNTNRAPEVGLTLTKYTVKPGEVFNISVSAHDLDGDSMTLSLKRDGIEMVSGSITDAYTTTTSFPDLGDHTISATVTDSKNESATASKGVDVADPNAQREAINPVMGDFNGDALSDLGLHDSTTGKWEICLSDKGVFRNAVEWLNNFGASRDWWPMGGDFNGDGKTDAAVYNNTAGELKVALSGGSSFSTPTTWFNFPEASVSWQPFTGNFNADKYTDFALYNKDTGEVKIALGTGTGFGALITWINSFGNDYVAMAGDFNGDGLSDLCLFKKSSGEFKVAFSNSQAFVDGGSWLSGFATNKDAIISDFNNDGLTDVGYWDNSGGRWFYAISTGVSFVDKGTWLEGFGTTNDESATTGDFDGNGVTDAACFDRDALGINRWSIHLSTNKPADLLTEIDNGIGGKTQVTYTYAALSDNTGIPFPVYVASAISSVNTTPADRTATYTQNFIFSGGYFDFTEREFRGFAKVRVTDPITNSYSETYFYQGTSGQDGALKGQIEKIISYDGNSKKISEAFNTYEVKKFGPAERFLGFPSLIEQVTTVYEENLSYVTTKSKFTYDNIGNPIEEISEGDTAKTGDEKSTVTTFAQAYSVGFNRPLETSLKDNDGNVVSKKSFSYDNHGNLTRETAYVFSTLYPEPCPLNADYSYDQFGNLVSTTNALGSIVTTEYETDFYTYPEKVTNSLGHTVQYVYELKFGMVKSVTDANGATAANSYDSFGRITQAKNALDQIVTSFAYPDFNTKVTTNAIGLSSTEYIDGLGRKYKTVSPGEDSASSRLITSEVYYNNRGLTEKESLPHYIDEDPALISYVKYEYDIRGRIKKTISDFPGTSKDAESAITYVNPLYTEVTDPQGHRKGTRKDIYGNIIEVTEFTQGGVYKTTYGYDTQNNLIKTIDAQGNITQIFYDSLGRKLKMIDPDMGTWAYEYDLVGNLKKQTDAKGQVLEFSYDVLNRLTAKRYTLSANPLAEYLYDDASKPNCIGRLSKVTDQSGSTEFFYDKLGREIESIKTVQSTEYRVRREYDSLDRLSKLTYPDGESVQYAYDANSGLLESIRSTLSAIRYIDAITYNAQGQIKVIKYGNGTETDYTYGQDLRLSNILTRTLNPVPFTLQDLNYIFDKNGNLSTLTDNLKSNIRTYGYDELDRLTEARNLPTASGGYTDFFYQYDSIGNMTYKSDVGTMTYGEGLSPQGTVPKPHALTSAGGYTYQYDANGNMVVGKNKTLSYDTENRLLEVNQGGIITSFTYDGDGGLVRKSTVNGQQTDATNYIGSLFEIRGQGTGDRVQIKHIFAGSNRVATVTKNEGSVTADTSYYHSDHLGSSNVISDATGALVQKIEYTPYGSIASTEPYTPNPIPKYLFTGKQLFENIGLYNYGARFYDPEIGRFITADTIVQAPYDPQSLNRYVYCRNNPINYVDPTGHSWFSKTFKKLFNEVGNLLGAGGFSVPGWPFLNSFTIALFGGIYTNNWSPLISVASSSIGALAGAGIAVAFSSPFLGTVGGAFTGGFAAGAGNAAYQGADLSQSLKSGSISGGIAAGIAIAGYGLSKGLEGIEEKHALAEAAGIRQPATEQIKGSPIATLHVDHGSANKVNNRLTFWDNSTEIYGKNFKVVGSGNIAAVKFATETPYSTGNIQLDKIGLFGKMGPSGFLFGARASVVEISSGWKIANFAGMDFTINSSAGWGVKFEAGLEWTKTGQAKFGFGFGPEGGIGIKWKATSE